MNRNIAVLKKVLRENKFRPQDRLGQNFLVDPAIPKIMSEAAEVAQEDLVLEIGAGPGTLTLVLAEKAGKVAAVEIDPGLVKILQKESRNRRNIEIVTRNILYWDFAAYAKKVFKAEPNLQNFKVVASPPYYLTTPLISLLLYSSLKPQNMVLLVQQEVAQKLVDKVGSKGFFSVFVEFWAQTELVSKVPRTAFWPVPRVDSSLIKITPRTEPALTLKDPKEFLRLVKAAFAGKRKQLKNSLAMSFHLSAVQAAAWLKRSGLAPERRAETLTLEEWRRLYEKKPKNQK